MYGASTGGLNFFGDIDATRPGDQTPASFERQANLIQYTSPTFNGFTANVAFGSSTQDRSSATASDNRVGENERRQTSLHLGYAQGPIAVGLGVNRLSASSEARNAAPDTTDLSSSRASLNWIAGSYDFGVARVFAAHVQREDKVGAPRSTTSDVSATSIGISVPMNPFTFRASVYRGSDDRAAGAADDMDLSGYQLAAIYALSRRTSVIFAHGVNEVERDGALSTATSRKIEATTLTVQHTF
jgi:predicted porin